MRGPGDEGRQHRWGECCARGSRLKCKREGPGKCVHVYIRHGCSEVGGKRMNDAAHARALSVYALPNIIGCITR